MNVTYNYITIDNYFSSSNNASPMSESEIPLSSLSQKEAPKLSEILATFKNFPIESLVCGTITCQPNRTKCYYDYLRLIEKQLSEFKVKSKNMKYLGFVEEKSGRPHVHMILYNSYRKPWNDSFKILGRHNTNDKSYCPVKNTEKYLEYIMKEYNASDKYYHNIE